MTEHTLQAEIETLFAKPEKSRSSKDLLARVRDRLQAGTLRVAEPVSSFDETGVRQWKVNVWVKRAILLMGTLGDLQKSTKGETSATEMDTLPWLETVPDVCRVPFGSRLRQGAYLAPGVTCMPPSLVQIGAHVGQGTAIDSMSSIGIGAQVGEGVQISCRVTIGGWLMPVEHLPTIVEDGALLGTGCGVYDGAQVGRSAILLAGTQIVPSLGLLDLRDNTLLRHASGAPVRVPPNAIVTMGTRSVPGGAMLQVPVIVGRRSGGSAHEWERYADVNFTLD